MKQKIFDLTREGMDHDCKKAAADSFDQACYYCGDTRSPAAMIKERNNQIICLPCLSKGVGKYDPDFKKK